MSGQGEAVGAQIALGEFTAAGAFIRRVVQPAPGEKIGPKPYSVGTPLGLGVDPKGNLFYADIGIVVSGSGIGPGNRTGTVRRVSFVRGQPQAPVVMDEGLAFPDGIGVWSPPPR